MGANRVKQASARIGVTTQPHSLVEITGELQDWIAGTGIATGLFTAHCLHTSASLLITENASPAVQRDLLRWLDRLAPEGPHYEHDDEGPDDMPAHLKGVLTNPTLTLPVTEGRLTLGTWQGIFLAEHRAGPMRRTLALHLIGS